MRTLLLLAILAAGCKEKPQVAVPSADGVAEVAVTEKGFEPPRVQAAPNQAITLRFTRKVKETCADAVDVAGDPVRHLLPIDVPVDVKVKAPPSGELAFACPMQMIHGAVVVGQ
ncbi:MAG: cupredoxin domain-containing protein [Myxococcales bacterium]